MALRRLIAAGFRSKSTSQLHISPVRRPSKAVDRGVKPLRTFFRQIACNVNSGEKTRICVSHEKRRPWKAVVLCFSATLGPALASSCSEQIHSRARLQRTRGPCRSACCSTGRATSSRSLALHQFPRRALAQAIAVIHAADGTCDPSIVAGPQPPRAIGSRTGARDGNALQPRSMCGSCDAGLPHFPTASGCALAAITV